MSQPEDVEKNFAQLYDRYYKAIYHTAYGILHNEAEAEDVMQDTFVSLWNTLRQGEIITNPGGWLLHVTRNRSYNATRRLKYLTDDAELASMPSPDHSDSPESLLFVHQMLSRLNENERDIVILHVIAGLKLSEIAQSMEIPAATVRWRYANARKQLRQALQGVL